MSCFSELVRHGLVLGASDIHLLSDQVPVLRIDGRLRPLREHQKLSGTDIKNLAQLLLTPERRQQFELEGQVDFGVSEKNTGRLRINLYIQNGSWAMAIRILPSFIPDYFSLGFPGTIQYLLQTTGGLMLVAGSTGSGKTTSLAAMINLLNQTRHLNVITLEDPIEYQYQNGKCLVNQREIGIDTESFSSGLKSALRQDPDLIVVGELRDPDTISIALTAAQTGHLVLASVHSGSSTQAIERIIHGFPSDQQSQISNQLANTLLAVIAQQLIPAIEGKGRVLAAEILIVNTAISNLIRENRIYQIPSAMQTGSAWGMRTMDKAVQTLCEENKISVPDSYRFHEINRFGREGRTASCDTSSVR